MAAVNMEECKVKVAFVGDAKVGKSSIISSFLFGSSSAEYEETIGVDFFSKNVFLEKLMVRMQIWDLSGHERFRELIPSYIRDAQALVVVYDVSNRESFTRTTAWVKVIKEAAVPKVIVLVGSKTDTESRTVSAFEGEAKAKELGCVFVEATTTSARSITRVFLSIAEAIEEDRSKTVTAQPAAGDQWIDIPLDQPSGVRGTMVTTTVASNDESCLTLVYHTIHRTIKSITGALPW